MRHDHMGPEYTQEPALSPKEKKQHEFWNHFICQMVVNKEAYFLANGGKITATKLSKIKSNIFQMQGFWNDIINHHLGAYYTPEELPNIYQHCKGNFWGMLLRQLS